MPRRLILTRITLGLALVAAAACTSGSPATSEAALPTLEVTPSASEDLTWSATAVPLRDAADGAQFTYACSPNGEPGAVWGTDLYTDDSSICTAAVHAGLITLAEGGEVTIELRPGEASYADSTRNGITSLSYPEWIRSFVFVTD